MKPSFLKYYRITLENEFLLLLRQKESFLSLLFFSLLLVLLFHMSLETYIDHHTVIIIPLVWLSCLLGGLLRMNRSFESENKTGLIQHLRIFPGLALPLYLSKVSLNFLLLIIITFISGFLVKIIFNLPSFESSYLTYLLPMVLGNLSFAFVGTLLSGMTALHHRKDVLLPVILYPLLLPLILAVIQSYDISASGIILGLKTFWLKIIVIFNIIFITVSLLLFRFVFNPE